MSAQHTPGPWHVGRPDGINRMTIEPTIACAYGGGSGELEANARLIAAAPELLEACRLLVFGDGGTDECRRAMGAARAAIAKATGGAA